MLLPGPRGRWQETDVAPRTTSTSSSVNWGSGSRTRVLHGTVTATLPDTRTGADGLLRADRR
jgi:hypothetical protein